MALCEPTTGEMVQMEQANEFVQEPPMAQYFVQDAARPVCPLECKPGLLIANTP